MHGVLADLLSCEPQDRLNHWLASKVWTPQNLVVWGGVNGKKPLILHNP